MKVHAYLNLGFERFVLAFFTKMSQRVNKKMQIRNTKNIGWWDLEINPTNQSELFMRLFKVMIFQERRRQAN